MISRLRLQNFRSHVDSELHLEPLSVLVGPAGTGKSNVFNALVLLQNSVHRELTELFPPGLGEFHWVRTRSVGETDPISFEVDLSEVEGYPGQFFRYRLAFADAPGGLYVLSENLQRREGDEAWTWVFQRPAKAKHMGEFGKVDPYEPSLLNKVWHGNVTAPHAPMVTMSKAVARSLSSVGYFHLEVSELKSLGTGQPTDRIDYYGGRLPDFLGWLKSTPENAPAFKQIREDLAEILPHLDTILVTQVGPDRQGLAASFKGHRGHITARDLSDGTMLTLGLLAIVRGPRLPGLLCLEEPETGLHPRRLRWLFDHMVQLAYPQEGEQRTQVLLTTHSADLVNLFSEMPEAVTVVDQQPEGESLASRVTALPDILAKLEGGAVESIGHAWATGLYESL